MTETTILFASEQSAARLLDMKPAEFRLLVKDGHLPKGREIAPGVIFASIGAGLDFLGGHQKRAPVWVQKIGMEWLWRALGSPLRLGPRYLRCLAILPGQILAARRLRRH